MFYWAKSRLPFKSAYIFLISAWIAFEKLHLFWDFSWSWLNLGNVFSEKIYWIQWYEYTGTFGGSLWILCINVWVFYLLKNEDFKSILSGKKISNKYLTIFFKKLSDKDYKKLNISFVTKKKIGNAVKRNRIKRRLRNIMDDAAKKIELNFKYCYLLIAKISVLNDPYENIKQTLFNDFRKIK